MVLALVSTSVFEASHTSLAIVLVLGVCALVGGLMGAVRAYFMLTKKRKAALQELRTVQQELERKHLASSSELTVRRKGGSETIKLPQHYTASAVDALLKMLAH